ncbi:MAG TPA: YkgJ family cysteine cluster protein [Labilithrix sp.]|nr:YkgJ family cysteine cluster protein [Labilithrix sp.]
MHRRLLTIYEDIERRTQSTAAAHPWWPCRRGCGGCCRRLADVPQLTQAEWLYVREGIDALAPAVRGAVMERIARLEELVTTGSLPPHVTCPILDDSEGDGVCLVYRHRPAACRTHGFYARRADELCCDLVVSAADASGEDVVWGNQDGIDDELERTSGKALPMTTWSRSEAAEGGHRGNRSERADPGGGPERSSKVR